MKGDTREGHGVYMYVATKYMIIEVLNTTVLIDLSLYLLLLPLVIKTAINMKASGKMIVRKGTALNCLQREISMRGNIKKTSGMGNNRQRPYSLPPTLPPVVKMGNKQYSLPFVVFLCDLPVQ